MSGSGPRSRARIPPAPTHALAAKPPLRTPDAERLCSDRQQRQAHGDGRIPGRVVRGRSAR
eukprot:2696094-Rhodomonas_salina.2